METPVIDSLVSLGSVVMELDGWEAGRGLMDLGISGLSKSELKGFLNTGNTA